MSFSSRSADTHTAILDIALDLFSKNGYDATSVAEICQQAQVSKGAFYYHFASKQALFLTLLESWLDDLDQIFQLAGHQAQNIPDTLESMAGQTGVVFDELDRGFPILLEFWTQASRQPLYWRKVVEPYRRYLDFFAGLIQKGMEEGSIQDGIEPKTASRLLMAVAMGLLLQASFDPDGADWDQTTRSGIKLILQGMRRQE